MTTTITTTTTPTTEPPTTTTSATTGIGDGNNSNQNVSDLLENINRANSSHNRSTLNNQHNSEITKILGLNVCGLRSKVNNGIFDIYCKDYDILCLSETKLDNTNEIDFSGTHLENYHCYIKEKMSINHQYGGVHGLCMLVKNNIVNHSKPVEGVNSPYVLWIKFNEKAFGLSCIIGSVYLPGEGSDHAKNDKEIFETIYDDIFYLRDKIKLPICLIGDMNSRTGTLEDTLDFEREVINNSEINDFADVLFDMSFFDENSIINKKGLTLTILLTKMVKLS